MLTIVLLSCYFLLLLATILSVLIKAALLGEQEPDTCDLGMRLQVALVAAVNTLMTCMTLLYLATTLLPIQGAQAHAEFSVSPAESPAKSRQAFEEPNLSNIWDARRRSPKDGAGWLLVVPTHTRNGMRYGT